MKRELTLEGYLKPGASGGGPLPPPPPGRIPPIPNGGWAKKVYIATADFGVYYTDNFVTNENSPAGVPTWTTVNTGLNLAYDCLAFRGDPFDPAGRQYYLGLDGLYRRTTGNWSCMLTKLAAHNLGGGGAGLDWDSEFGENGITCNINVKGFVAVTFRVRQVATYKFGWCVSTDYGATWTFKTVFTSATATMIFCPEVGALKGTSPYAAGTVWYCGSKQVAASTYVHRSLDNGATWSSVVVNGGVAADSFAVLVDPNDQSRVFISGLRSGGAWHTGVSTDHGATFAVYDTGTITPTGSLLYSEYHLSVCMDPKKTVRVGCNTLYGANVTMHQTKNNGANWADTAPQYSNQSLGISLIQDAMNRLYLLRKIGGSILLPHVVFASENEGLVMTPKGGANADVAGTGNFDSIPFDCGGVRGILQVWTARAITSVPSTIVPPAHELGSAIHTGELGYQQLVSIVGSGPGMVAAGDHHVLSATHGDTLPAAVVQGDIIRGNATPAWERLPVGGANQVLTSNGVDAAWAALPAVAAHDVLSATHGDTLPAAVSRGSVIVGNNTPKWAELAIGANEQVLTSDGTDAAWATVVDTKHIHAYKENKSAECDGVKVNFVTANEFEPGTLLVVLERAEQVDGAAEDYEEDATYDAFTMAVAPGVGDKLIMHYIADIV